MTPPGGIKAGTTRLRPRGTLQEALAAPLLGDRLRLCREARGLSMRAVVALTGFTCGPLCQQEQGQHRPSLDNFFALARIYEVDPVELYEGTS